MICRNLYPFFVFVCVLGRLTGKSESGTDEKECEGIYVLGDLCITEQGHLVTELKSLFARKTDGVKFHLSNCDFKLKNLKTVNLLPLTLYIQSYRWSQRN